MKGKYKRNPTKQHFTVAKDSIEDKQAKKAYFSNLRQVEQLIENNQTLNQIAHSLSSSKAMQIGTERNFTDTSSKIGTPLLLDFIDMVTGTPKRSSSSNIMMKSVDNAIRYSYQGTPYRTNLHTLNKTVSAARKAINDGKFKGIVYDLETITGKNESGKDIFTAITEVSMRIVDHSFNEKENESIHAIIGLSSQQESNIRQMLSGYMSGQVKFQDLEEQQKVAVQEILNFSYASVKDTYAQGLHVYQTQSKRSREEIEQILLSKSGKDLSADLEKGISTLRNIHDKSDGKKVLKNVARQIESIDGKHTFGIGANILVYDNTVMKSMGLIHDTPPLTGFIDITELYRQHTNITGMEVRGGAQQSHIYSDAFNLPELDKRIYTPHIAHTDTFMSAQIAKQELSDDFSQGLLNLEKSGTNHNFEVGGIYKSSQTVKSPIGFILGDDGSILTSTGYYQGPNRKGGTVRNFAYDISLNKDVSYELISHNTVDISQLTQKQMKQLQDIAGDRYINDSNIHLVGFKPILDSNTPTSLETGARYVLYNDRDFDAAIGSLKRVGTHKVTHDANKITGRSKEKIVPENAKNINSHITEKAVRSFEDNPYKMMSDFSLFYYDNKDMCAELSTAIASGNQDTIDNVRVRMATQMRLTYEKAGKANIPELSDKLTYSAEHLSSLMPIYEQFNVLAKEDGLDQYSYAPTFKKALNNFSTGIGYVQSQGDPYGSIMPINAGVAKSVADRDSLILKMPNIARSGANSDAMTLKFGQNNSYDRFKIVDKLRTLSDKKLSGIEQVDTYNDISLLGNFVLSLTNSKSYDGVDEDGISAITEALKNKGIVTAQSDGTIVLSDIFDSSKTVNDIINGYFTTEEAKSIAVKQSKGELLSSIVYDALSESGIRSNTTQQRTIPHLQTTSNNGLQLVRGSGRSHKNIDSVDDLVRVFTGYYKSTEKISTMSTKQALSKGGHKQVVDTLYSSLVDTNIDPIRGSKFVDFLKTRGFNTKEIADKTTTIGIAAKEYESYISDLMYSYLEDNSGLMFQITDNGLQVRDTSSDWQDVTLPKLKVSDNGTVYWQYGSKDMSVRTHAMLNKNNDIALHSDFAKTGYIKKSSHRTLDRERSLGNKPSAQTFLSQVRRDMNDVFNDTPEAFAKTESSRFTSGGRLNVTQLIDDLFNYNNNYDTPSTLGQFKEKHLQAYTDLTNLYKTGKAKLDGKPIEKLTDLGQDFYEVFTANSGYIFSSISDSFDNDTQSELKNIFAHLSASATQEKIMDSGDYLINAPRYGTALSGFLNQKRNTGYQNAKAPTPLRLSKMSEIGAKQYRPIETKSSLMSYATTQTANEKYITSARVKAAHLTQEEYFKVLEDAVKEQSENGLADIEKVYGSDTFGKALRLLETANLENDGSFITADLANALPTSDVNNKMIDLVNTQLFGIKTGSGKKDTIPALSMIPKFSIDSNGSVNVEYSKEFYIKQGDSLIMLDKDLSRNKNLTNMTTTTKVKKGSIASIRFFDDNGIELAEDDIKAALSDIEVSMLANKNAHERNDMMSNLLKQRGISLKLKLEDVRLNNKIGYGEEKSFSAPLALAFGSTKEMTNILDKYRITDRNNKKIDSLIGSTIRDDAFKVVAKELGMSDDDVKQMLNLMHSPTAMLDAILDTSQLSEMKGAKIFTNINEVKHQSVESNIADFTEQIVHRMKKDDASEDEINQFLKKAFGEETYYSSAHDSVIIKEDIDRIHSSVILDKYHELFGDNVPKTSTVSVVAPRDWSAGKVSGHIAKDLRQNRRLYEEDKLSLDDAIKKERLIKESYEASDRGGIKISSQELEALGRYRYNEGTLSKFIGAESNDEFISTTQQALERKGVLSRTITGDYIFTGHDNDMIYDGAYRDIKKAMTNGQAYEMHSADMPNSSIDKVEAYQTVTDYRKGIQQFNKSNNARQAQLINEQYGSVTKAKDIVVPQGSAAKGIVYNESSPYSHDAIIDLGDDFGEDRYLGIKGIEPKFFAKDDESQLVKNQYQQKIGSLQKQAEIYDALKNDTLSLEADAEIFGRGNGLTREKKLERTKEKMISLKNDIVSKQDEIIISGKNSINHSLSSTRADISGMLETQTANIISPDSTLFDTSIYKDKTYNGVSLSKEISKGNLVDFAVINSKTAEDMGIFDQADDYVNLLKSERPDYYNKLLEELGSDASSKDIMKLSAQREGINMYTLRYPTVHEQSLMSVRAYTDDTVKENMAMIAEYTQKKMKNDNDSDKIGLFSFSSRFVKDQSRDSEHNIGQRIQAIRNKAIVHEPGFNPEEAIKSRSIFGDIYRNIADSNEYEEISTRYNNNKYREDFEAMYKAYGDDDAAFLKAITTNASTGGDQEYFDNMKQLYVDKRRLTDSLIAQVSQSSKSKIGYINNSVANFTSIGDQYTLLKASGFAQNTDEYIKYQAANELINRQRGDLIENIINAKNTTTESQVKTVSDMLTGISDVLTGKNDKMRDGGVENLHDVLNIAIGSKYDDYITESISQGKYLSQYLTRSGFDISDMSESNMNAMKEASMGMMLSVMRETPVGSNIRYKTAAKYSTPIIDASDGALKSDIRYMLPTSGIHTDNIDTIQENADRMFDAAKIVHEETENVADDVLSGVRGSYKPSGGNTAKVVSQAIKNNVSKNIGLGAIGVAGAIMAVGIIGGNPSHAPQEDSQNVVPPNAYRYDNYNYATQSLQSPPMPQMNNTGYVVNMRASTNGSYLDAEKKMAYATQQNYNANSYAFTMNRKFSYSANQDNDAYVEGILNRLI